MNISPEMASNTSNHIKMYELISVWLGNKLNSIHIGDIKVNKSMQTSNYPLPPLISSLRKIPDLCIYDRIQKTRILLQIEVDSGNLKRTLRKLALSLIDQLRYQRNLDDSISTCIGFYFPNNSSSTSVMKVTLIWLDETTDY